MRFVSSFSVFCLVCLPLWAKEETTPEQDLQTAVLKGNAILVKNALNKGATNSQKVLDDALNRPMTINKEVVSTILEHRSYVKLNLTIMQDKICEYHGYSQLDDYKALFFSHGGREEVCGSENLMVSRLWSVSNDEKIINCYLDMANLYCGDVFYKNVLNLALEKAPVPEFKTDWYFDFLYYPEPKSADSKLVEIIRNRQ